MNSVPRVPECDKRRLVAPGFNDDNCDRDLLPTTPLHFIHHPGLSIPLVGTHPGVKDPARGELRGSDALEERTKHVARRAPNEFQGKYGVPFVWIERRLNPKVVGLCIGDVKPCLPRCHCYDTIYTVASKYV